MKYFFISDLHVDFYAPLSRNTATLRKYFERFFEQNFLSADACCIAGDIANDYFTYVEFLKFIADKYSAIYVCLGNHDIITEIDGRYGVDREFATSEEKIAYFLDDGSIWQAGHTHTAIKRVFTDAKGKRHLLLCNPVGYPEENPYAEHELKREDFVVDVE